MSNRWFKDRVNEPWSNAVGPGRNNIANVSNEVRGTTTSSGGTGQNLMDIPPHQACKYITSHGICQTYQTFVNNGDNQSAMQAVSTFANQEGIPVPSAYQLILQCCGNVSTGDIPCEDFWPSVQQQQGWCQKWQQAQGNPTAIQSELNNLSTVFGITTTQAQSVFTRCCPGTGDEPCPPTNPNSPFYTTDRFCETDWCVDGQGNPLPSAHPDCRCCPDTNVIDVSPWCPQYVIAVDNADLSAMQSIITAVSTTFSISWTQASQLLYDECVCPDNGNAGPCPPTDQNSPFYTNPGEFCTNCGPGQGYANHPDCQCCPGVNDTCKDPNWAQLPWGGQIGEVNYIGGKNNYCDRCGQNNQGATFPVSWGPSGEWQYDPQNGTNYCGCCPDTSTPPTQGNYQSKLAGGENNPIGLGSLTDDKLSFTGDSSEYQWAEPMSEWEEGQFLTDSEGSKGRTLSMEDFINEIP